MVNFWDHFKFWCWQPYYVCPDSPRGDILEYAQSEYLFGASGKQYEYGDYWYETVRQPLIPDGTLDLFRGFYYDSSGTLALKLGQNGKYEINCFRLVEKTAEHLGIDPPRLYSERSKWVTFDPQYWCKITDLSKVGAGDIILWEPIFGTNAPTHIAIIHAAKPLPDGSWNLYHFGAQSYAYDIGHLEWNTSKGMGEGNQVQRLVGIYRPKELKFNFVCKEPNPPAVAFAIWIRDPLLLDLDGGGIKTVGLNAGIHFDHDKNGFKELTGWVAAGDGVLMLDMNGNGRLDSGRELFGGMTILPNGVKAANGFQALAYYDANGDGRIDANDPVWSQLRVWRHLDYDSYYESESLNTNTPNGYRYFVSQDASGCG